jgi:hypothetical protein
MKFSHRRRSWRNCSGYAGRAVGKSEKLFAIGFFTFEPSRDALVTVVVIGPQHLL